MDTYAMSVPYDEQYEKEQTFPKFVISLPIDVYRKT